MKKYSYILIIWCLLTTQSFSQQSSPQLFYLSIGSGLYEHNSEKFKDKDFIPYDNIKEAEISAEIMGQIFEKYFGAKGITITSSNGQMIKREDFFSSLDRIFKIIEDSKANSPVLILYYCGHGFLDTVTLSQVCIPGDYTLDTKKDFNGGEILNHLVHNADVLSSIGTQALKFRNFRSISMYDCCKYSEEGFPLDRDTVIKRRGDSAKYWMDIFDSATNIFNLYIQSVKQLTKASSVYAVSNGKLSSTYSIPSIHNLPSKITYNSDVGPLCRRSLIALDRYFKVRQITIQQYLSALSDKSLDSETSQAYLELISDKIFSDCFINF